MQIAFRFASLIWIFLQRCIARYKIPCLDVNSDAYHSQHLTLSLAKTIHPPPCSSKHTPSALPISANATIIHQLFKLETWVSSLTPPLRSPPHYNPTPATIISLEDSYVAFLSFWFTSGPSNPLPTYNSI